MLRIMATPIPICTVFGGAAVSVCMFRQFGRRAHLFGICGVRSMFPRAINGFDQLHKRIIAQNTEFDDQVKKDAVC